MEEVLEGVVVKLQTEIKEIHEIAETYIDQFEKLVQMEKDILEKIMKCIEMLHERERKIYELCNR
jgi:hypothetical protein